MDACRFSVFDPLGHVTGHPEVRVLVDSLRDEAWHLCVVTKDVREWVWERGSSLDGWEGYLATVAASIDSEDSFDLIESHVFLNFENIRVQIMDVLHVWEDEGLLRIKSESDDVLDVGLAHLNSLV